MDEAIGGKANIDPVAIVTMRAKLPGESSTERSSIPPTTSNGEIDDELLLKDPDLKGIKSSKRKTSSVRKRGWNNSVDATKVARRQRGKREDSGTAGTRERSKRGS